MKQHIQTLVELCHRYGSARYVNGGGGNVSWKNGHTMWIKASGTNLSEANETTLVAVRREPLKQLYETPVPRDINAREAWAKQVIDNAVAVRHAHGRPSVETPLHDLFDAAFVVHTHPALVNGLTCAREAEAACKTLFPEVMWVPYVDPGVTLCMVVKRQFDDYIRDHGREPSIIIMQNHGLVVAADDLDEIDALHDQIFDVLETHYLDAGLDTASPVVETEPANPKLPGCVEVNPDQVFLKCSGFQPPPAPLTPDHIVYGGVAPLDADDSEASATYHERFGSNPRLVTHDGKLYAVGATVNQARTACELAADGAHVMRLTDAFGGARFMSESQWRFVVSWEAEAYRQSVNESN